MSQLKNKKHKLSHKKREKVSSRKSKMHSKIERKPLVVFRERGTKLKTLANSDAQMYPLNWIKVW